MWEDQKKPLLSDSQEKEKGVQRKQKIGASRSCNDILFVILFVACCVGMVVISSVAFSKGDPSQLVPQRDWSDNIISQEGQGWFTDAVAQARQDKDILIGAVAAAVLLGVAWIQLLKMFTTEFVYGTLIVGVFALIGLGAYVVNMGMKQDQDGIKIVGYVIFGLDALLVLLIIFLRKKIALTCAMFKEACRGVQHNPALFVALSIVVAGFLAFAAFWVSSFIYLWSIPDSSVEINPGVAPKFNEKIRNLLFYQVFAFFWVAAFLSAVYQHVVAGSVAGWYFSRDMMSKGPRENAMSSLFHAVTTSFGSLAFGSLVLAFVQFLNVLLEYSKKTNPKNRLLVCLISCLQCFLACIEGIVQYINKFAYIYVAMHGYSFCHAARECFELISRNFFNAVIMDTIAGFVLFVGKALFTAICAIITIGVLDAQDRPLTAVTLGLVVVIAFTVLHIISHVVGVSVDTVFICYLEDLEMNKGENMYISPDLHALLQESASKHKAQAQVSDV